MKQKNIELKGLERQKQSPADNQAGGPNPEQAQRSKTGKRSNTCWERVLTSPSGRVGTGNTACIDEVGGHDDTSGTH